MRNITKLGWYVLGLLTALAVWGLWQVATNLWYVGEGGQFLGYCWGSMQECLKGGL
jgi:hypothetical protein